MHRLLTFKRLSVVFLSLFAVCVAGAFAYERLVTAPGERCTAQSKWWDPETQICAQPISIAEITGRPIGQSREEASNAKNRELLAIEAGLRAERNARDADAARQRRELEAAQRGQ